MKLNTEQGHRTYVRYITKKIILDLLEYEKQAGYRFNRMPNNAFLKLLVSGKNYPVLSAIVHNGVEMRCHILAKPGITSFLDMPFAVFFTLPVFNTETQKHASGKPPHNMPTFELKKGFNIVYMLAREGFAAQFGNPGNILSAQVSSLNEMTCVIWNPDRKTQRSITMTLEEFFALPTRIEEWPGWNQ